MQLPRLVHAPLHDPQVRRRGQRRRVLGLRLQANRREEQVGYSDDAMGRAGLPEERYQFEFLLAGGVEHCVGGVGDVGRGADV